MTQNIYYVGAERQISTDREINSHLLRDDFSQIFLRERSQKEKDNYRKSTSSPKTERSRYTVTLQRLRNKSPRLAANTLNYQQLKQPTKKDNNILTVRNSSQVSFSSAFHRISVKPVIKQKIKGNLFKKVQQPRYRQKGTIQAPNQTNFKTQATKNRKENEAKVGNTYQNNKIFNQSANKKGPQHQSESTIELDEHYKAQPLRKLFLCMRCYQFTPIIEIRGHHLSCRIPLKKQDFVNKWLKVINLLKEIFRQLSTNQLFRLIDRMQWYISECNIGHREGHILYSSELACVLSLKSSIKINCIDVEDLFWLIETLGDLIETKSTDLQETGFWKICY